MKSTEPPTARIPAVILAGGVARRLGGQDKAGLSLAGRPLLSHGIERLSPQAAPLLLSANGDAARFQGFGVPVIGDTIPGFQGPLAGIVAALEWLEQHHPGPLPLLSVSVDTPFLPTDLVARLVAAGHPAAYAQTGETPHPTIALWPRSGLATLRGLLHAGERRLRTALHRLGAAAVMWPLDGPHDPFFNINTADDLAVAEARLLARPSP